MKQLGKMDFCINDISNGELEKTLMSFEILS